MREEKEGKSIQGDFMAFLGLGNCLGNKKKKNKVVGHFRAHREFSRALCG